MFDYNFHASLSVDHLQLENPTEWRMKDISLKVRSDIAAPSENDDAFGEWRYYLHFPADASHKNHLPSGVRFFHSTTLDMYLSHSLNINGLYLVAYYTPVCY